MWLVFLFTCLSKSNLEFQCINFSCMDCACKKSLLNYITFGAAMTNYHKFGGLEQQKFIHKFGDLEQQKFILYTS